MIGAPPSEAGGLQETVAEPLPATADTPEGFPGTVTGLPNCNGKLSRFDEPLPEVTSALITSRHTFASSQVNPGISSSSTALTTSGAVPTPTRKAICTWPVPGGSGPEST